MTFLINDIKIKEGLQNISLPFKEPIEVVLQEVIQTSVRTFSHYKPLEKECYTGKDGLKSPDDSAKKFDIYYIPTDIDTCT